MTAYGGRKQTAVTGVMGGERQRKKELVLCMSTGGRGFTCKLENKKIKKMSIAISQLFSSDSL